MSKANKVIIGLSSLLVLVVVLQVGILLGSRNADVLSSKVEANDLPVRTAALATSGNAAQAKPAGYRAQSLPDWDPFQDMARMQYSMNRMLESLFDDPFAAPGSPTSALYTQKMSPAYLQDDGENYLITLAVPGLSKEQVRIDLKNRYLIITVEKRSETKKEDHVSGQSARSAAYSNSTQSIRLPNDADEESIEAGLENGMLRIKISKQEAQSVTASIPIR